MKELHSATGSISREISDQNSNAGIAWAKFHSVYPHQPQHSLNECIVEGLMSDRKLAARLGTTQSINTAEPGSFYRQLQKYVDSKEKVGTKGKTKVKESQKAPVEMEYWPLIKVVRIYTKASALSTGAVIVDLPGVHDSNAARAAVAQGYMKQCSGLWIVAPINRAVDDKAAKTLLGDSFKRQLKYDGGFSDVTFICSKTDDISITEAIDTLGLEKDAGVLYEQQRQVEEEIGKIQEKLEALKEKHEVYRIAQTAAAKDTDVWEQLKEDLEDGNTVFAPVPSSKKRKMKRFGGKGSKKRRSDRDDD